MNETLLIAALAFTPLTAVTATNARRTTDHLRLGQREIRVEFFAPHDAPASRTVLLFHGVGGLLGDGALMRRTARAFVAMGFRAGIVHYFNATGTLFATHANVRDHAGDWRAAMEFVARHYAADAGAPVGLFGYSLGGFLAVGAAPELPQVGGIVVLAGGILSEHESAVPGHLPPLLILHGGADIRVPPERAEALARLGRLAGAPVEAVIYAGEGHTFSTRAERDALERSGRFFAERLQAGAGR
jgi:carboxymethylenebutenolidase